MLTDLFLRGRLRQDLGEENLSAIEQAVARKVEIGPRTELIERGERLDRSYYVVEGTMLRHIGDRVGGRQLVGIHLPGDFLDLHGYPMKRLDHTVTSLSKATLAEIPHRAITSLVERSPSLARALWFSTLLDAAMHRGWIYRIGRLRAEARIAHLLCELAARLRLTGRFDGRRLPLPLLQSDYADACGMTAVHANRCFRILRDRALVAARRGGRIEILDEAGLRRFGQFDGDYLYAGDGLASDALGEEDCAQGRAPARR